MADFSKLITDWYKLNYRQLPWRNTQNAYIIWLSEVILQQTRVAQGLPYFERFVKKFPTVKHLAKAHQDEVLKLWQGLGYYSRARNMHYTAQEVLHNYKGVFPNKYDELIQLKGVGEYTAAAIASFSSNEPVAVVDGNVYRLLSRYFGIETPIDTTEGKRLFKEKAIEVLDSKNPAIHNQAIMEFGAIVCTPKNPNCEECVLSKTCIAYQINKINILPVKSKKTKIQNRYLTYSVIHNGKSVLLKKREENDIWKGLYEFPLVETSKPLKQKTSHFIIGKTKIKSNSYQERKHILSHRKLWVTFFEYKAESLPQIKGFEKFSLTKKSLPSVPQVILRYLEENNLLK